MAGDTWHVLKHTIQEFHGLSCDDDHSFGNIGGVEVDGHGWIALAKHAPSSAQTG